MDFIERKVSSVSCDKNNRILCQLEIVDQENNELSFWGKCFRQAVSSIVMMSYFTITTAQTMAMDKVHPEGCVSPIKRSAVAPDETQGNQNSVLELVQINNGEVGNIRKGSAESKTDSNDSSDAVRSRRAERVVSFDADSDESLDTKLEAFRAIFDSGKTSQTWKGEVLQLGNNIWKMFYLAGSCSVDSVINAPTNIANAAIWTSASARRLIDSEYEMPEEDGYYQRPMNFYRDNAYYDEQKDQYMQSLLATVLFGSVVYSINAKAKFAGYTIFDALAKKAEMYELFYYEHPDNPYYRQDQFMQGMFIYSWIALPFFLLFESCELGKLLWPTREEARLKEHHGFYTEKALNFISVAIAFAAGYFAYSAYYTAAAGLLGTPQTTEKDLTTYPGFLGYSTALTMYAVARRGADSAYRSISREQYGDEAGRERGMNEEAIDFYQEAMKKKFSEVKVSPEVKLASDVKLSEDIEAQTLKHKTLLDSSATAEELEESLRNLSGTQLLTEMHNYSSNHKPVVERHTTHDLSALEKLREQSEASIYIKFMQGMSNSMSWVVKNSWWIVPAIVCTALVYPTFTSCQDLVQWSIQDNPQTVSDYVYGQQLELKLEILQKYEDRILADPAKWQANCFKNMRISANVTDDENFYAYYYAENNNQTADYLLHFTTPHCLGVDPNDPWISGPGYLEISDDNGVFWFNAWKSYALANSLLVKQNVFSTTTKTLAYIAAGIYTPTVYSLSVLGTSFVLYQGSEILANPELAVSGKIFSIFGNILLTTPAFIQGVFEAASQGIEGYLALDATSLNDAGVYTCTGLIAVVSALILTPDFYKVQKKIISKVKKLMFGRSALEELLDSLDELKELNESAKFEILKAFGKSYQK